jgi:hypothetical protein
MPVRGTTRWAHAINDKKVWNFDAFDPRRIICAWLDCTNDGYESNKVVVQQGQVRGGRTMTYVFCSERHKRYWVDEVLSNLHRAES